MNMFNEPVSMVVSGIYQNRESGVVSGVYRTLDDRWLLIGENTLERVLDENGVSADIAWNMFQDELYVKFLDKQLEAKNTSKHLRGQHAADASKRYAKERRLKILAMIVGGKTKSEVEEELGVSLGTVNLALRTFFVDELQGVFQSREEFDDVPVANMKAYIACQGDYVKFRNWLQRSSLVESAT